MPAINLKGASFLVVTIFVLFLFSLVLFIPIPQYNSDGTTSNGPSIVAQIMGEKADGVPITTVYYENITSRVESPYELVCQSDLDCQTINVRSQCRSYCANSDPANASVTTMLERNRVCDPAGFAPQKLNCRCVLGSCTDL